MLTIKETNDKQKYGVDGDKIVLEGKDGENIYGFVIMKIEDNILKIEKISCDDFLLADGLKRAAFNYALNRQIIEADCEGKTVDIIEFFNKGCK